MNDRDLERVAQQLGSRAANALDAERVAARVIERLRAEPLKQRAPARQWFVGMPVAFRVAAALALLVAGGLVARRVVVDGDGPFAVVAPLLPDLSADELHEVLDSLAFEAPLPEDLAVGLTDLTESQLRELLKLMEG